MQHLSNRSGNRIQNGNLLRSRTRSDSEPDPIQNRIRFRTGSNPEPDPNQNRIHNVRQRIHKADIRMLTPLADNRTGSIMFVGVFIKRIFGQQRRWRRRVFAPKYGSGYRVFAPEYGNGYVVGRQIDSIGSLSASVRRSCSLPGMPLLPKANFVPTTNKYRFIRQRRTRQRIFASGDPVRRSTTPAANKLLRGFIFVKSW